LARRDCLKRCLTTGLRPSTSPAGGGGERSKRRRLRETRRSRAHRCHDSGGWGGRRGCGGVVARMERSDIRDRPAPKRMTPDFAALNPGYGVRASGVSNRLRDRLYRAA
jgi:hypothetical protein